MKTHRHQGSAFAAARHGRGSALLLVMWALILLSAAVLGFAQWIQRDLQIHSDANRELEARAMAHSGMALAMHPGVSQKTPGLEENFGTNRGFQVRIVSEGGKLNIRWLLEGEDPIKLTLFKRWLEARGLTFDERERFVDCLLDWTDTDNAHRLNGKEDEDEYHPANRALENVEEIAQVYGSAPLTRTEGWQDELTIFSQGPIDLTSANEDVLRLVPGIGEARMVRFLQVRRGRDGVDGTLDDYPLEKDDVVASLLGLGARQYQELRALVTRQDPTLRITSEGHSADVYRQVEVVVRKGGGYSPPLFWKE